MYEIKCDTHTHTLYSRHAFSTIAENVKEAADTGLELLGSTDHFSAMLWPDVENAKNYQYLANAPATWPRTWMGVTLLAGCEVDIVGLDGALFGEDIPNERSIVGDAYKEPTTLYEHTTRQMDYVIASVHGKSFIGDASRTTLTDMYIQALSKPKVFILGHVGRTGLDVDYRALAEAAKAMHKCLEVNEHSFGFPWSGGVNKDRCRQILAACADVGCQITIATDAHIAPHIGKFEETKKLLTEVGFPEELIASRDRQSFLRALKESCVKDLLTT